MSEVFVQLAHEADLPVAERLWLMFCHDMSEFRGALPDADGTFRSDRLHAAFTDPGWAPYLVTNGERPLGLAVVRGLDGPVRVLSGFFVVRGARGTGVGLRAVRQVVARHPGTWEIAFQDDNAGAARFWRRVATAIAGDAWTEEHRLVPNRPDLPPDAWISFTARGAIGEP
ncbi:GNAT family N-acetyltransferase [Streptosporangium sp. NPDC020072]|uniref:GNAT family N-acetyltransferase n=1 Tax=Streptosporangium sp. NPDC020072 TaxID=3154788 RepID=UPI003431A6F6